MTKVARWCAAVLLLLAPAAALPQASPNPESDYGAEYARLLTQIRAIPILDNHSHPGFADDPDVDAMVSPPEIHEALRFRLDNPEYVAASKRLFDYPYTDATPEHLRWLAQRKIALRQQYPGTGYFDRILDKLNVEGVLANRVAMPAYLDSKRFRWVFFVDSLLFPLNNTEWEHRNADLATYMPLESTKLKREMAAAGLSELPRGFDQYLQFVTETVERQKALGGVGIKFEIGYLRSLRFEDPSEDQARTVYERYRASGAAPPAADYQVLQDYLFRYLLLEAGRLKLPVQIHTAGGVGDFYSVTGGSVLNLENILRDPRYSATKFVLLHGGYPWQEQAILLTSRPNVYLDSSLMSLYLYPEDLATVLRHWLSLYPEKVVFGADAFPFNEAVGAEESLWLAVESSRTALAAALAQMVVHREITEARALGFAHMYLHDTAAEIYSGR